jgi:hypothetical protein
LVSTTKGKSGRGNCAVCRHKHRHTIDLAIVAGVSGYVLAERFDISDDSIYRHAKAHLSPVQRAALATAMQPCAVDLDQLRKSESEGLLSSLVAQRARLAQYGEVAAELGDLNAVTRIESAILSNLQTVGKLLQQFVSVSEVRHSSILLQPDYLRIRDVLTSTLRQFPDAAIAVSRALARLESEGAEQIIVKVKPRPPVQMLPLPPPLPNAPPPPCS